MRIKSTSYDWAAMIQQLIDAGRSHSDISGGMLTDKMIFHYRRGVQPLHWRGEMILNSWCAQFQKDRAQAPMRDVERGHRVDRREVGGPQVQYLPQWPVAAPVAVKIRKKPGPKPKARVEA